MGPREFAAIATPSAFRAALNECPSSGLQFLLDRLDKLYSFKLAVNGHAALLQLAPSQDGDVVNLVLPLHIASISLVFKDPGDCHPRVSPIHDGRAVLQVAAHIRRWSVGRVLRLPLVQTRILQRNGGSRNIALVPLAAIAASRSSLLPMRSE